MNGSHRLPEIHNPYHKERGAVLVVGLIILGILMMGALSMMQTSIQDERIVSNKRMQTQAFLTAEAGVLAAQVALNDEWEDKGDEVCEEIKSNNGASDINEKQLLALTGYNFNANVFASYNKPKPGEEPKRQAVNAKYTVYIENCAEDEAVLTSIAMVDGSGASVEVAAAYEPPQPPNIDPLDPPAAISCFGGACEISISGGGNGGISGKEHDIPVENCSGNGNGAKSCNKNYNGGLIKPAVYMSAGGNISITGGGSSSFSGADPSSPGDSIEESSNKGNPEATIWNPGAYKDAGMSEPSSDMFFGNNAVINKVEKASDSWGSFSNPAFVVLDDDEDTPQPLSSGLKNNTVGGVMVIDGIDVKNTSTGAFAGLIIIKNCGSFSPGGNYHVYGAIIVDSSSCTLSGGTKYRPFGSGGTPSVKYSLEAIQNGIGTLPPLSLGMLKTWQQNIKN